MIKVKLVPPPGRAVADHTNLPCSESELQNGKGQPVYWLPNHNDLPDKDDAPVTNSQEHPQSRLLSSSLEPLLRQRNLEGQYYIGQDTAIFFWIIQPEVAAAKVPDWFYVPGVPSLFEGAVRRSFILWQEPAVPLIVLEYVSGSGQDERDRTPGVGKWWAYEKKICAPYYGIYEVKLGRVEVYHLVNGQYELLPANDRGHFPIAPLDLELGIWQGRYAQYDLPWLRWWDAQGNLLPSPEERAEQEAERARRLAEKLRELGVDPNTL